MVPWPQGCYDEEEWAVSISTFWTQLENACGRQTRDSMQVDDGVHDGETLIFTVDRVPKS